MAVETRCTYVDNLCSYSEFDESFCCQYLGLDDRIAHTTSSNELMSLSQDEMLDLITIIRDISFSALVIDTSLLLIAFLLTAILCCKNGTTYSPINNTSGSNINTSNSNGSNGFDMNMYTIRGIKYVLIISVCGTIIDVCLTFTQITIITHFGLVNQIENLYDHNCYNKDSYEDVFDIKAQLNQTLILDSFEAALEIIALFAVCCGFICRHNIIQCCADIIHGGLYGLDSMIIWLNFLTFVLPTYNNFIGLYQNTDLLCYQSIPIPTYQPTVEPTIYPTMEPTFIPTVYPTISPTFYPSMYPTLYTLSPSAYPTMSPTIYPSEIPTQVSMSPTSQPTVFPTQPTQAPVPPTPSPTLVNGLDICYPVNVCLSSYWPQWNSTSSWKYICKNNVIMRQWWNTLDCNGAHLNEFEYKGSYINYISCNGSCTNYVMYRNGWYNRDVGRCVSGWSEVIQPLGCIPTWLYQTGAMAINSYQYSCTESSRIQYSYDSTRCSNNYDIKSIFYNGCAEPTTTWTYPDIISIEYGIEYNDIVYCGATQSSIAKSIKIADPLTLIIACFLFFVS